MPIDLRELPERVATEPLTQLEQSDLTRDVSIALISGKTARSTNITWDKNYNNLRINLQTTGLTGNINPAVRDTSQASLIFAARGIQRGKDNKNLVVTFGSVSPVRAYFLGERPPQLTTNQAAYLGHVSRAIILGIIDPTFKPDSGTTPFSAYEAILNTLLPDYMRKLGIVEDLMKKSSGYIEKWGDRNSKLPGSIKQFAGNLPGAKTTVKNRLRLPGKDAKFVGLYSETATTNSDASEAGQTSAERRIAIGQRFKTIRQGKLVVVERATEMTIKGVLKDKKADIKRETVDVPDARNIEDFLWLPEAVGGRDTDFQEREAKYSDLRKFELATLAASKGIVLESL